MCRQPSSELHRTSIGIASDADLRPAGPADIDWIVKVHERLYHEEAGFDATFGAVVRDAVTQALARADPDRERTWVLEDGGEPAGTLFVTADGTSARLRLFLLLPRMRGRGFGRAMLETACSFAARSGHDRVVVATYDRHRAACRLYTRSGFVEADRRPITAFGQHMIERHFARVLASRTGGR